jgi:hypothetical protein
MESIDRPRRRATTLSGQFPSAASDLRRGAYAERGADLRRDAYPETGTDLWAGAYAADTATDPGVDRDAGRDASRDASRDGGRHAGRDGGPATDPGLRQTGPGRRAAEAPPLWPDPPRRAAGPPPPHRKPRRGLRILAVLAVLAVVAGVSVVATLKLTGNDATSTGTPGAQPAPEGRPLPTAGVPGSEDPGKAGLGSASPSGSAGAKAPGTNAPGQPSTSGFPGSGNTGPGKAKLASYSGPCKITKAGTVIDGKSVKCGLDIRAKNVVIRNSFISGHVNSDDGGAVTIQNSEVDDGTAYEATVSGTDLTVQRSNIHGGEASVNCWGNCTVVDSWLHGQYMPDGGNWHLDAFLSNGASNVVLRHNTLACDHAGSNDGGCSANVGIFGDFAKNSHYTVDHNLFVAGDNMSYCTYGGSTQSKPYPADNMVFVNNVFQRGSNGKCGQYGPVAAFDQTRPGSRWENNVWDNGQPIAAPSDD